MQIICDATSSYMYFIDTDVQCNCGNAEKNDVRVRNTYPKTTVTSLCRHFSMIYFFIYMFILFLFFLQNDFSDIVELKNATAKPNYHQ